jgi:hypothetical protein
MVFLLPHPIDSTTNVIETYLISGIPGFALPIDLPAGICFIGVMVMTSAAIQLSAFELDDDAERFLPELLASAMATRLRSTVHRYF